MEKSNLTSSSPRVEKCCLLANRENDLPVDASASKFKPRSRRLLFVDVLKIIGITLVLLQHEATGPPLYLFRQLYIQVNPIKIWYFSTGSIGVEIFIVASGLSLAYSHPRLTSWSDIKNFYSKRLLRIYPAYWICGIFFALLLTPSWLSQPHNTIDLVKLISGFPSFGNVAMPNLIQNLNSPLWFMTVILQLYLVFPILLYVVGKHPHISIIALLSISLLSRWIWNAYSVPFLSTLWFLPFWTFEFGLGIYLAKVGWFPKIASNRIAAYLGSLTFFIYLVHIPLLNILDSQQLIFLASLIVVSTTFMAFDNVLKKGMAQVFGRVVKGIKDRKEPFSKKGIFQGKSITHLYFGLFGGFVGVVVAGLVMRTITSFLVGVWFPGLIFCGALGGLGFGALTTGDRKMRGIIGSAFGVTAILFGFIMTYATPVVVGFVQNYSSNLPAPIYEWRAISCFQFLGTQLLSLNVWFFGFFGIFAAYWLGSRLALKNKLAIKIFRLRQ